MTLDTAVALSLLNDLSRIGLTARLDAEDPLLFELARPLLERAARVRREAADSGIVAVAWNDPRFPHALRVIPDCPPVLWCRGVLQTIDTPMVAIVGSRAASAVALETASRLADGLAALGVTVVSGLARGVDSAAHRGALRRGRTVAVLGSGLDIIYPAEHRTLSDEIAGSGVVLTEYPPATPPLPFHFPMRNRLISGLCIATIVVEAAEKSGSLITASSAIDQGREVMVVPGSVAGGRNRGGHALIRDGAALVETIEDVAHHLGWNPGGRAPLDTTLSPTHAEDAVLRRIGEGDACGVEQLATETGMSAARLLQRLAELELSGLVRRLEGGRFVRQS